MNGEPEADDAAAAAELEERKRRQPDPRDALSLQTSWLRSFLAVADKGGFGAATVALHLSQSRVSAHIAALEHALGVSLFDRKARPTRTTEAGELFREHAMNALVELQRGVDVARGTLDRLVAHVSIASYPSVSSTYLPEALRELKAEHPGVSVELHEGTAASLEEMVTNGTVDLAFRPLLPKMRDSTLCHRTIWREDIVAVMCESDPCAGNESVGIEELLTRPLIGNPSGAVEEGGGFDLRNALGEAAARADVSYLTDQPATLVALVRSAFGIGVINRLALQTTSIEGLVVRTIDSPSAHRDVALFWAQRRGDSAVVRAFLDAQERAPLPAGVTRIG